MKKTLPEAVHLDICLAVVLLPGDLLDPWLCDPPSLLLHLLVEPLQLPVVSVHGGHTPLDEVAAVTSS